MRERGYLNRRSAARRTGWSWARAAGARTLLRYFFYITNIGAARDRPAGQRPLDQENAQLKSGVGAMRVPVYDLVSNWSYMVMAALAWNLRAGSP